MVVGEWDPDDQDFFSILGQIFFYIVYIMDKFINFVS